MTSSISSGKFPLAATSGASNSRIYYDSVPIGNTAYPRDPKTHDNIMKRYLNRKLCDLIISDAYEGNREIIYEDGTKFSILNNDLLTYINNNVPHNNNEFTKKYKIDFYDIVDETIPRIEKMYGMNRLLSNFKGKKNYLHAKTFINAKLNWQVNGVNINGTLFTAMLNAAHPDMAINNFTDVNNWTSDAAKIFWTNSGYKKLYSLPKSSFLHDVGSNRNAINQLDSSVDIASGQYIFNEPRFLIFEFDSREYRIFNVNEHDMNRLRRFYFQSNNCSIVVFWSGKSVNDNTKRSIYVKPVGIDVVNLNNYDQNKYDLEMVYTGVYAQQYRFLKIYSNRYNDNNNTMCIPNSVWLDPLALKSQFYRKTQNYFPEIHFRLRDKITKNVGPLSNSKIVLSRKGAHTPIKFIIR